MSGSFAYIPSDDEIPPGMVHVGWYCTAQKPGSDEPDGCLRSLADVDSHGPDGEVYLFDSNHHGGWEPIYVKAEPEPCGAVFPAKPGQDPCRKPRGHEHGPDTDWKRDLHSNGMLKWRVDGADLPWRFDVPEVPDSVTALKDSTGEVWLRVGPGRWSDDPERVLRGAAYREFEFLDLFQYGPLVECEDPRAAS